jgi:hypothetical protein
LAFQNSLKVFKANPVGQTAEYIPNSKTLRTKLLDQHAELCIANSNTIDLAYVSFRDPKPVMQTIPTPDGLLVTSLSNNHLKFSFAG